MTGVAGLPGIYRRLVGARVRATLQYRTSFALDLAGSAAATFLDFAAVLIIFESVPRLDGWSLAEVAFLYGVSGVAFALCDIVMGHFDGFPEQVRTGSFDVLLVRPLGTLFQLVAGDLSLRKVGRLAQAVLVLGIAIAQLDVSWTAGRAGMVVVMLLAGTVIFSAVWVAGAAVTIFTVETSEVTNAFTYGGNFLTSYPLTLYGAWLRRLLAFVLGLGFVTYFPALYVLDRADPLGFPQWLRFASPAVALLAALAAGAAWRAAVRHYRSTGS